jgi:hypothetical protein
MSTTSIEINCVNCGNLFKKFSHIKNHKFCCLSCKEQYRKKNPKQEDIVCSNCKISYVRTKQQHRYKNNFCCIECEKEFRYIQNSHNKETRKCEICNIEFKCKKSSTKRFCTTKCQGKWQSTQIGVLNPRFKSQIISCDWCKTEYYEKLYKINNGKNHFCSNKCRQTWYAEVWSKQEEWKEINRINTVKLLESGHFSHANTKCQLKVNEILNRLNIKFTNEKGFRYFAVDNYLNDFNLCIEVMGTFWHCDHRENNMINYEIQIKRIRMDKIKHTYIKKYHDIEILYLWEQDIMNNEKLCEELIKLYIDNRGILNNYHSFNYKYNNALEIINDIEAPYMDYHRDKIRLITDTTVKEKISHKQEDRWIIFNCQYCGKEREELICHYNKNKNHYCSTECYGKSNLNRIEVVCSTCSNNINIKVSLFNKNKHKRFFCNQKCQHIYQKTVGFKKQGDTKTFNCENCGLEATQKNCDYNKSKHHYCSKECFYLSRKK